MSTHRRLPGAVAAGAVSGLVSGLVLGGMVGPLGMVVGLGMGLVVGTIAGLVIDKEDKKQMARTRELDAIIGITEGTLGAGGASLVPIEHEPADPESSPAERESWVAEWLTPPPPVAGER